MNAATYQAIVDSNQWMVLWPEIALGLLALLLLVLELVLPKDKRGAIPRVAVLGQVLVLIGLLGWMVYESADAEMSHVLESSFFSGLVTFTPVGQASRVFILVTSLLVSYIAQLYFQRQKLPRTEFFHVQIVVTAAMMLLVQSTQFVLLFVALETVTVGFYVLVAYGRNSALSLEAGLKYLILGALSSALLLFGIVLLYGVVANPDANPTLKLSNHPTDAMNFVEISRVLGQIQIAHQGLMPMAAIGIALVLCGIAFKIGVVPFQIWVPDVYQGAPTPTTAFLAVGSKAVGFMVLLNLISGPFSAMWIAKQILVPLFTTLAILSILYGNLAALTQRNVKRVMGLSGIAHAGYIMVGLVAAVKGVTWAPIAVLFYLTTYMLASMGVFGVMAHVAGPQDDRQELDDYADLGKRQPFLGGVLAVGLGSLAGIPPLAGFIGKLLIFFAAFQAHLYVLLGVSIIGVVISIYYYFAWMREALFRQPGISGLPPTSEADLPRAPTHWGRVALGLITAATLLAGLYQGFFPDSLK